MNNHLAITTITCLLAWMLTACSGEELSAPSAADGPCTYTLRLEGSCQGFDDATRANVEWEEGSLVYIRFQDDAGQVDGTATYKAESKEWTVECKRKLVSDEGACRTIYFENPEQVLSTLVSLSTASVTYADSVASYLVKDGEIMVRTKMTPLTGRIRFKGTPGKQCEVWGFSYHSTYSFSSRTFSDNAFTVKTTIGEDGFTGYYHAFFPEDRTILCGNTTNTCFSATFGEEMLGVGKSGYITLPTADNPGYWTLVNRKNLQPITLPEIEGTTASSLRSSSVLATVKISSTGNGTVTACGVLCSQQPVPDLNNSTLTEAQPSNREFSVRVKGLQPAAHYYLRAYVTNEKGTTLGDPVEVTTLSVEEDTGSSFDVDDYDEDNAEGDNGSDSDIGKDDFGPDNEDDDNASDESAIDKDDFGEDENYDV